MSQTWSSSDRHTSMKWLPPPSVPSCFMALPWTRRATGPASSSRPDQNSCQPCRPVPRLLVSTEFLCIDCPTGTAASMSERRRPRSSGRSEAVREVRCAVMPQPMSTPTAAGETAPRMAMTEPTVAPMP